MNEVTTIERVQPEYSAAAKKALARKPQLFINGEWVDSSHDKTIDHEDPSTGKVIGKFGTAGKQIKEFGLANSIDCRNENELLVGEMTNWRVQRVSVK